MTDLSAQKKYFNLCTFLNSKIVDVLNAQNMFNRILQQHQCLKGECYYSSKKKTKNTHFICLVFEVTQVQRFGQSPKWFSCLTFMQWLLQGPAWVWLSFLTAGQTVLLRHAWKWAYGIIHSNICTHPTLRALSVSSYPKTLVRCDTCHTHATPIQDTLKVKIGMNHFSWKWILNT